MSRCRRLTNLSLARTCGSEGRQCRRLSWNQSSALNLQPWLEHMIRNSKRVMDKGAARTSPPILMMSHCMSSARTLSAWGAGTLQGGCGSGTGVGTLHRQNPSLVGGAEEVKLDCGAQQTASVTNCYAEDMAHNCDAARFSAARSAPESAMTDEHVSNYAATPGTCSLTFLPAA